jgi:ATP-dependent DNA helicase RecG
MKESQHIEWKESWRDEYLRWICGFANAEGGVLVIGRNDKGVPVGVTDAKKLLLDLPNKIRDVLGIMADVRLVRVSGKDLIEIRVEPYPYPVSYKGEYHLRSGSTKQELKGAALDRFLLRKQGRTWDGVPVPNVSVRSLSGEALKAFRSRARRLPGIKALQRRRAAPDRPPGGRSFDQGSPTGPTAGRRDKAPTSTDGSAHPQSGAALCLRV